MEAASAGVGPLSGLAGPARRDLAARARGTDALLLFGLLAVGIVLLAFLRSSFDIDSWLELVDGRLIWQTGLPHHDTLAVMTHGASWIDQQWLAQLGSYALYRLGGLGLLGVVNVGMLVLGLGLGVGAARRRGAGPRSLLVALPLVLWLVIPSREVRTQAFAVPLFVALVLLLAQDARRPSARVYWCLPILVLWANLHGTASFGAGLVCLRAITLLWERRAQLRGSARGWLRPLALAGLAPLCLLATPYGLGMAGYYEATLGNSALKHAVTEWQPIVVDPVLAVPFFLLVLVSAWALWRRPRATTLWEKLALLGLALAAADALRGALLFGLCVLVIIPAALSVSRSAPAAQRPERRRLNLALGLGLAAAVLSLVIATLRAPASYLESHGRQQVAARVAGSIRADSRLRVLADLTSADWLLWRDPQLAGRLAYDARFELLSAAQLGGLERMMAVSGDWKRAARGYRLLVLDAKHDRLAVRGFLREPGRRVLYRDSRTVVILRSVRAAAS